MNDPQHDGSKAIDVRTYKRTILARPVTFTCELCEQTITELRYPGPTPRYCRRCKDDHARALARLRKASQRARARADQD